MLLSVHGYTHTDGPGQPVVSHLANLSAAVATAIYKLATGVQATAKVSL